MSKFVTKKQLENIRSGQTYYSISKDQFGVYKIWIHSPIGKKVKSHGYPYESNKRFKTTQSGIYTIRQELIFPDYKLFWTKRAACKYILEHKQGRAPVNGVANTVRRVRKQEPTDTDFYFQLYAIPLQMTT